MSWLFFDQIKKDVNIKKETDTIHENIRTLDLSEELLSKKIKEKEEQAKEYLRKKNKNGALKCMKIKKLYENQLNRLNSHITNQEMMKIKVEDSITDMNVFNSQKKSVQMIKKIYGQTTVDKIHDEIDNIKDVIQDADDISKALTEPLIINNDDEDELLDELNNIEEQIKDEKKLELEVEIPNVQIYKEKEGNMIQKFVNKN